MAVEISTAFYIQNKKRIVGLCSPWSSNYFLICCLVRSLGTPVALDLPPPPVYIDFVDLMFVLINFHRFT